MKRFIIFAFFLSFIFYESSIAQMSFGLYSGVNIANIKFDNPAVQSYESSIPSKVRLGIIVGGFFEINVLYDLYVGAGINYLQKGNKSEFNLFDPNRKININITKSKKLSYIEIPIYLKAKINLQNINIYLLAGSTYGLNLIAEDREIQDKYIVWTSDSRDIIKKNDIAIDIGIGGEYKFKEKTWVFLNVQYSGGMSNIYKPPKNFLSMEIYRSITWKNYGIHVLTGLRFEI